MSQPGSTAAIILAAGSSSRMGGGRHKLLLPLNDLPVLAHVIAATLGSKARPIILVLGHQAEQVRAQITPYATDPSLTIVENPAYLQGMSTSMHAGLQALNKLPNTADSALFLLGDQPLITSQIIDRLITTKQSTRERIIAPLYAGKRGSPTLFDAALFEELLEVTGDEGGRSILERHRQEVRTVELHDVVASYDVDTWEAYQQVVEAWEGR